MKKNKQAGNTLTIVLICLMIITILSMSGIYSIAYTSTYKLNKSKENFNNILTENAAYELINEAVIFYNENKTLENFNYTSIDKYVVTDFIYLNNSLEFKIRNETSKNALFINVNFKIIENKITNYEIKKWGTAYGSN